MKHCDWFKTEGKAYLTMLCIFMNVKNARTHHNHSNIESLWQKNNLVQLVLNINYVEIMFKTFIEINKCHILHIPTLNVCQLPVKNARTISPFTNINC